MKHYIWHRVIFTLLRILVTPFIKLSMGYRCKKAKGPDAPTLILANHNTDIDPALVALGFSRHMYFVASEHALRKGFFSKVLSFVFAPIAINKTQMDAFSVKEILHRLKAGFNVCLFAEGNRSYTGVTGAISPSTAKLVKISKAALITYRLEGGYLTTPRWAKNKRKGKIAGSVVGRYSPEELAAMTNEQIQSVIERDLHEDAYKRQEENPVPYRGKDLAEHIEMVLYLCPACKKIGTIHSRGDYFSCSCGLHARYTETGFLEGDSLLFSTVTDWNYWQTEYLETMVSDYGDGLVLTDERQQLFLVQAAEGTSLLGEGILQMSRTALSCAGLTFPLEQIARMAIVDRMTLLFALNDGTEYEIRSAEPRSALKYVEMFRIVNDGTLVLSAV